jgi:hypothetical protein
MQLARRAFSRARANTGNKIAAKIAMIAITTKSSISVKARLFIILYLHFSSKLQTQKTNDFFKYATY